MKVMKIGIAIFHGIGDILNCTPIAKKKKEKYHDCHITWYTLDRYAFLLENNPYIDKIVPLSGNPKELDESISRLKEENDWDEFLTPAPYMNYNLIRDGQLLEIIKVSSGFDSSEEFQPVIRLSEEERKRAEAYWSALPEGPKILLETEFFSDQSHWTDEYVFDILEMLKDIDPVFVFTCKSRPVFFDKFKSKHEKAFWCNEPFKLNAEFYNRSSAFIGISSGISCLSKSDYCRNDVPSLEVSRGFHWSGAAYKNHDEIFFAYNYQRFIEGLVWIRHKILGSERQYDFSLRHEYYTSNQAGNPEAHCCAVCGSEAYLKSNTKNIVKCWKCGHTYRLREFGSNKINHSALLLNKAFNRISDLDEILQNNFSKSGEISTLFIGEFSREFIKQADARGLKVRQLRLEEIEGDYDLEKKNAGVEPYTLNLQEESVNLIILSGSLERAKYPFELFEKLNFLLSEKGILYCNLPNYENDHVVQENLEIEKKNGKYFHNYFSLKTLKDLLPQTGFFIEKISCKNESKEFHFYAIKRGRTKGGVRGKDIFGLRKESLQIPKELRKYVLEVKGNQVVLAPNFYPDIKSKAAIEEFASLLAQIGPFYFHLGGAGDALLLLSTFYDSNPEVSIFCIPNSIDAMKSFYKSFDRLKAIYILPSAKIAFHIRSLIYNMDNCLGRGITPVSSSYEDEWNEKLDIFRDFGVAENPAWTKMLAVKKIQAYQVTIHPKGSILGVPRSKRNIVPPAEWKKLLSTLESYGIRPVIIGTPDEDIAYPADENCINKRSYDYKEQMEIIASSDCLIGADSWAKTLSALCNIPTFVFESVKGEDLRNDNWKDSSEYVFVDPWKPILTVRNINEFVGAFNRFIKMQMMEGTDYSDSLLKIKHSLQVAKRKQTKKVFTSYSHSFWNRNYENIKNVHIRCSGALGDALNITNVIKHLKSQYPHLEITVSVENGIKEIFNFNRYIKKVVRINSNEELAAEAGSDTVIEYVAIIDRLPEYYNGVSFNDILANIAGVKLKDYKIDYTFKDEELKWARNEIGKLAPKGKIIGLQLNTPKDQKRSYTRPLELIEELYKIDSNIKFIIFGSNEFDISPEIVLNCHKMEIRLREQLALAHECDAFITIDSAYFHVAHNLCAKPTMLISGPTNPLLIGDINADFVPVMEESLDCLNCYWGKKCNIECMSKLNPSVIAKRFVEMLSQTPEQRRSWRKTLRREESKITSYKNFENDLARLLYRPAEPIKVVIHDPEDILPEYSLQWNSVQVIKSKENRRCSDKANIIWEGSQFVHHSLALVNRELEEQLINNQYNLSILPYETDTFKPSLNSAAQQIICREFKPLPYVDIHIRHQWPCNLSAPEKGHWVIIQPWEFGSLPKTWVDVFSNDVDEMWVPSNYVRDLYISSGVPAERVFVVPNGFDKKMYNQDNRPYKLSTKKKFKFLFVGGTIYRKGVDILLETYVKTFKKSDDVCLVIKDMGGESFYKGQTFKGKIAEIKKHKDAPEIEYIDKMLSDKELAGLYTACDVLVHPYRGEGFGLPILEAMASGIPAIVTNGGACLDFCSENNSILVNADKKYLSEKRIGDLETVDFPWFYEVKPEELAEKMNYALNNQKEVKKLGIQAAKFVHSFFTWEKAFDKLKERVEILKNQPIKRMETNKDRLDIKEILARMNPGNTQNKFEAALAGNQPFIEMPDKGKEKNKMNKEQTPKFEENLSAVSDNPENVKGFYKKEQQNAGSGFEEAFIQACNYFESGDFENALVIMGEVESFFNSETALVTLDDIKVLKGSFYLAQNDLENARISFEEALKENPQSSEACLGLGTIFYQSGMPEEAKVMLEWAAQNDPQNKNALNSLAKVNLELGYDEYHSSLNEESETSGVNEFESEFNLAYQYFTEEKFNDALLKLYEAEAVFDETQLDQSSISLEDVSVLRGSIYLILNEDNKARLSFEKALNANPQSSEACHGLAEIFFRAGMFEEARTMFEWAVKNNPENESAINRLNTIAGILGQIPENSSADDNPSKKEVESAISEAYELYQNRQFNDSISKLLLAADLLDDLEHESERNEFTSVIENMKGMNYLGVKKVDKAKASFSRALELNPQSSHACAGLGEVFYLCEMDKEAKTMYEWALKNDETNQFALSGLKKVNQLLGYEENDNSLLN